MGMYQFSGIAHPSFDTDVDGVQCFPSASDRIHRRVDLYLGSWLAGNLLKDAAFIITLVPLISDFSRIQSSMSGALNQYRERLRLAPSKPLSLRFLLLNEL